MTGIETTIRGGDRVRHKDGTESVAIVDALGGLIVVRATDGGLLAWWASDVTIIRVDAG